ncbi:hypothetical protein GCM10011608_25860 [Micromonospora sonchi]|uniref:Gram-positive cocci surface proteins LPxTG domain-containing protein n=1 Tax=Micromonospora sonchi TaxID=1763543 RepID=A0A917WWQ7_9ACTN|nr:hypothetical protein [Micromonospora sonchi]GGM39909.1 hypothetical protein GCM10011608_25860 [Micromonospora sonchi]
MRLNRIIMAITVGLAVVAVPAAAVAAQPQPQPTPTLPGPPQPYPPGPASLTLSDPSVSVGETVDIIGRNFGPNETVDMLMERRPSDGGGAGGGAPSGDQDPGSDDRASDTSTLTVRTDSGGQFVLPFTPRRAGVYTITATGRTSGFSASTELRVLRRPHPTPSHHKPPHHKPPHHLPVTGTSLETPMKIGGGLVAAGALLLLGTGLWRRRNRVGAGGTH